MTNFAHISRTAGATGGSPAGQGVGPTTGWRAAITAATPLTSRKLLDLVGPTPWSAGDPPVAPSNSLAPTVREGTSPAP